MGGLSAGWGWHAGWREMQPEGWCLVSAAVAADASRKGVQGASGVGGSGGAGVGRLRGAVWLPGCMQQVHAWASLLGQDARPACRTPCNSAQQSARPAKAQQRKRAAQRLTFLRACWHVWLPTAVPTTPPPLGRNTHTSPPEPSTAAHVLAGLLEHVAHAARAHAREHLHELRAGCSRIGTAFENVISTGLKSKSGTIFPGGNISINSVPAAAGTVTTGLRSH